MGEGWEDGMVGLGLVWAVHGLGLPGLPGLARLRRGPIHPSTSFLRGAVELAPCAENSGMTGNSAPSKSNFDKLTLRQRGGLGWAWTGHAGATEGGSCTVPQPVNMTFCHRHNVRYGSRPRRVLPDRRKKGRKKEARGRRHLAAFGGRPTSCSGRAEARQQAKQATRPL